MSITNNEILDRILSLIPKKENGDFQHGAKKKFALSIGYNDGQIVSMWINGSSDSYLGKLYEIAAVYNVSVEWLRGETDEKRQKNNTAESGAELSPVKKKLLQVVETASDDDLQKMLELLEIINRKN